MVSGRHHSQHRIALLSVIIVSLLGLATATTNSSDPSAHGFHTLEALYSGNKRFRNVGARKRAVVQQLVEEPPSFMFLGCTDNRFTPASLFQAPVGSIITQNNIGNQYNKKDISTDAAITYAIEDLGVQHIIVLGHYDCKGAARAVEASKERNSITEWVEPLLRLFQRSRRRDVVKYRDSRMPRRGLKNGATEPPDSSEPGFRAFIEENVKETVKSLKENSILAKAYQVGPKTPIKETDVDVYVHGWVHDPDDGTIKDLQVSFGPPGKVIPPIPFEAAPQAKNFHRHKSKFNKGKVLKKPKYII